jgi:hypothetical protein
MSQLLDLFHGATEASGIIVYKSYLDETGIKSDDPFCIIAGYVGDVREWQKVDDDWKFVLADFGVPYFHALAFYRREDKCANWKASKRVAYINALFDCIRDHEVWLVTSAVEVPIFLSLTEDERRIVTGGEHNGLKWKSMGAPNTPYFVPFQECILQASTHVPRGEVLYPIMSKQDQYEMKALELYDMILNTNPPLKCRPKLAEEMLFSNPKAARPLQAADLAAYWSGKVMRYLARNGKDSWDRFPHRVELRRLFERVRDYRQLKLFNFEGLMLSLQFVNRHIKTSFPTLDQLLPSLSPAERKRVLAVMWKVTMQGFLDQWQPSGREDHGRIDNVLFDRSEPLPLRWIKRLSQPEA